MSLADIRVPTIAPELGCIRQVAYIVKDIDVAMKEWQVKRGVKGFVVARDAQPLSNASYRGKKKHSVIIDLAFGYLDDLQVELIELKDDTPSMYKEALDRNQVDLQHYAVVVEDFDGAYQFARDKGFETIVDSGVKGIARMSYIEATDFEKNVFDEDEKTFMTTPEGHGIILEVIEWNGMTKPYFDTIQQMVDALPEGQLYREFSLSSTTPIGELAKILPGFIWKAITRKL